MRLTEAKIQSVSDKLLATLQGHEQVTLRAAPNQVAFRIRTVITEDLRREDALDEEVRQLLEKHLRGRSRIEIDHEALFNRAKRQLIRERRLVI